MNGISPIGKNTANRIKKSTRGKNIPDGPTGVFYFTMELFHFKME